MISLISSFDITQVAACCAKSKECPEVRIFLLIPVSIAAAAAVKYIDFKTLSANG